MTQYQIDRELRSAAVAPSPVNFDDLRESRLQLLEALSAASAPDSTGVRIIELDGGRAEGNPPVPLRIYRPNEMKAPAGIYDVHGGGFVIGSCEVNHARNIELARELGVVVVAVDYRLAPETTFPGPFNDVHAGFVWMSSNAEGLGIDADRIAVHGVSAGAGLCAAVALKCRDDGGPRIAFQYLATPELDDRLTSRSMALFVDTPVWNRGQAMRSWAAYLGEGVPGTDAVSPYAAPARATDFADLPPTYISVMEFDPLRDEGVAFASDLLSAGVSVELHLFPGTFHGSARVAGARVSQRDRAEELAVMARGLGI
jgi:acetyl esterase